MEDTADTANTTGGASSTPSKVDVYLIRLLAVMIPAELYFALEYGSLSLQLMALGVATLLSFVYWSRTRPGSATSELAPVLSGSFVRTAYALEGVLALIGTVVVSWGTPWRWAVVGVAGVGLVGYLYLLYLFR